MRRSMDSVKRLAKNRTALVGLITIGAFLLAGLLAPVIAPYDPYDPHLPSKLARPSSEHVLGCDELGRDLLSRILYGARISLFIGTISVSLGLLVGAPLGAISGFYGGKVDLIIQRFIDILMAFPGILLAIMVVSVLGVGLWNAMIAIGVVSIPVYTRLVRGSVLAIREQEYVQAARAIGASDARIILRHIVPNALGPIIVQSSLQVASAILWAAGLGFLGLGARPPLPEWGAMLSRGRVFIRVAPHATIFPGLAIMLSVLGFNLLGDGLRDLLDPRLRGKL